jgi:hypothetical protein
MDVRNNLLATLVTAKSIQKLGPPVDKFGGAAEKSHFLGTVARGHEGSGGLGRSFPIDPHAQSEMV